MCTTSASHYRCIPEQASRAAGITVKRYPVTIHDNHASAVRKQVARCEYH